MGKKNEEIKVLMPEERKIKLSFGNFTITELGVKQIIKIVTFSKPIFLEFINISKINELKKAAELSGMNVKNTALEVKESDLLSGNMDLAFKLLELAGDKITDFVSIVLKTPEPLKIDDIPIKDMLVIIDTVLEVNDIPFIKKVFLQAMEKVIKEIKTAKKK